MVRSYIKQTNIFRLISLLALSALITMLMSTSTMASNTNIDFNVDITEVLTISITDPVSWASGDLTNVSGNNMVSNLLRNKVTVTAITNNATGATVSMYTPNTDLINQSSNTETIPTLNSSITAASFPANRWGYSVTDTVGGDSSASYNPLSTTAQQIFTTVGTSSVGTGSKDVFFGAKADNTKKSGTYAQTVYFVAVTGTIDTENPQTPLNPSTPAPVDNTPTYVANTGNPATGQTTYTTHTSSGSGTSPVSGSNKTTTTEVSKGDTRNSYTQPAGVTKSKEVSKDSTDSSLTIALGTAAGVAAVSGVAFLVAAKRNKE